MAPPRAASRTQRAVAHGASVVDVVEVVVLVLVVTRDSGGGGGSIEPSIRIGSLRAIGTGRLEPGAGLSHRSSYQPAGRSAGTKSGSWPAAAPGVGQ